MSSPGLLEKKAPGEETSGILFSAQKKNALRPETGITDFFPARGGNPTKGKKGNSAEASFRCRGLNLKGKLSTTCSAIRWKGKEGEKKKGIHPVSKRRDGLRERRKGGMIATRGGRGKKGEKEGIPLLGNATVFLTTSTWRGKRKDSCLAEDNLSSGREEWLATSFHPVQEGKVLPGEEKEEGGGRGRGKKFSSEPAGGYSYEKAPKKKKNCSISRSQQEGQTRGSPSRGKESFLRFGSDHGIPFERLREPERLSKGEKGRGGNGFPRPEGGQRPAGQGKNLLRGSSSSV